MNHAAAILARGSLVLAHAVRWLAEGGRLRIRAAPDGEIVQRAERYY